MRKSLLITSAFGLVATALPALAMAGAAAGSSSAVCGSGFFAQFDAKIMNAKLEIKNEKPEEKGKQDVASAEAAILAEQEQAYKDKMKLIFAGLSEAQLIKLKATVANGGLNLRSLVGTAAAPLNLDALTAKRELALVLSDGIDAAAITAARAAANRDALVANRVGVGITVAELQAIRAFDILNADEPTLNNLAVAAVAPAPGAPLGLGAALPALNAAIGLGLADAKTWGKVVDDVQVVVAAAKSDTRKLGLIQAAPAAAGYAFHGGADAAPAAGSFLEVSVIGDKQDTIFNINNNGGAIDFGQFSEETDLKTVKNLFVIASKAAAANSVEYADAAAFTAAQTAFLAPANATIRAAAVKNNGWFRSAVNERKVAIANNNAKIDVLNKNLDRRVHNHALAGGVGATVGWWQNLGGFALSISGSGDYLWGTFRAVEDVKGSTVKAEDKRRLGFGFQGDVGAHYVVSPSTTLGILVGIRGQQLNIGKNKVVTATSTKDSKGDYASKWMINPVVTLQARTFFTDTVYGALSLGYIIPMSEKDFKEENTNIDKDAKVRFQGLTGAFSVGMMF